jgi:hypothetical protein
LLNDMLWDRTLRSVIPMIRGLIVLIHAGRRSAEWVLGRDLVFVEPEFRGICSRIVGVDLIRGVVVLLFTVVCSWRNRDTLLWGVHRISVCRIIRRIVGLRIVAVLASINRVCLSSMRCLPRVSGGVTLRIVPMPPRRLSAMTPMRSALTCWPLRMGVLLYCRAVVRVHRGRGGGRHR